MGLQGWGAEGLWGCKVELRGCRAVGLRGEAVGATGVAGLWWLRGEGAGLWWL